LEGSFLDLKDPHSLEGITEAVIRIKKAKRKKEKVFIFGDYDVDGISACALLKSALEKLAIKCIHYLPHRLEEGYGLNLKAVLEAKKEKVKLFICVDCGISAFKEIEKLKKLKIDSIVIDHHEPRTGKLPPANVIINPKLNKKDGYFHNLAAVGLVFKLAQALYDVPLKEDSDLAALGTICDVAKLVGDNRIIVKEGLKHISHSRRVGIQALKEISGIDKKDITPGLVGFVLGPRLNAMGRIDSAEKSLRLLTSIDKLEAKELAKGLNDTNRKRQRIEEKIFQEALSKIEREVNFKEQSIIVVGGDDWHPGVVGIVASKLADRYYRPAFVLGLKDHVYHGSGRSINNFHLFDALSECESLLQSYGGHRQAAGISVLKGDLDQFRDMINSIAKLRLKPEDLVPELNIEADIPLSTWKDHDLVAKIDEFAPFGVGNPRPVFCSRNLFLKSEPTSLGRKTLRLWVSDGELTCKAIGFGLSNYRELISENSRLDLAYSISIDTWHEPVAQLEIKDIKLRS